MDEAYPLPFMIESGGARYALVEQHNLRPELKNEELLKVVIQAMAWIVSALKYDARHDLRLSFDEQAAASFLCNGDEYYAIMNRAADEWHSTNPTGTMEQFRAQFDIEAIDDSVRQPLPEWVFYVFDEDAPWTTTDTLEASGFRGVFYIWNTRTIADPTLPPDVWLTSPNPMLGAPHEDNEWWLNMFADVMHAMLSYELPLSDGRRLWLQAWQFPTARTWLAWRSGEGSVFVPQIKQLMIAHGLSLPDPVYVVEERFIRPKPIEIGGGWMTATRRILHYSDYPLW